ncbi:hypothetical protein N0B31_02810 [Salinirubellus salinus]|uniref:Uncharacterized protein n=1 Tax=Salinirubellus salinus TaxID=1364945 RepID=A0A9E7R472_9EURY|nr:hypothetical protein [Salinirubellus salinus]UWM55222.1 hypothetical protein N0B31_02810 [Salinirubellus salinus]
MIEYGWLLEQRVPWWAFLLALLTRPSQWSTTVWSVVEDRMGGQSE